MSWGESGPRTTEERILDLENDIQAADKRLSDVARVFGVQGPDKRMVRDESATITLREKNTPRDSPPGTARSEQDNRAGVGESSFANRFNVKPITLECIGKYRRPQYIRILDRWLNPGDADRVLHPTYQDQLFLFHEHGPWIMKKVFELLMFCQSICMATFIVIWLTLEEWTPYQYIVFVLGVTAPALNLWWLVPRLISKFAIVTSIDFSKDISLCESIMSDNKKLQIVETLRMMKIARMEGKIERLNTKTLSIDDKQKYLSEYHDNFPSKKKNQFEHMFHVFDADGSGSISPQEMRKALISLGIPEDSTLVTGAQRIIELIDVDKSETIELEEFQTLLAMAFLKASPEDQRADLEALFKKFDINENGFLSIEELALAFDELGVSMSTDDMAELVYQVFVSFKQQLSLHEFGEFMEGLEDKFAE